MKMRNFKKIREILRTFIAKMKLFKINHGRTVLLGKKIKKNGRIIVEEDCKMTPILVKGK